MLKRHHETLDEQYRAGIRDRRSFRVGKASNPEQLRRLSDELWRAYCEVLKTAVASQMHDVESVMGRADEAVRLGAAGTEVEPGTSSQVPCTNRAASEALRRGELLQKV